MFFGRGSSSSSSSFRPIAVDDDDHEAPSMRTYEWEGAVDMSWASVRMDQEGRLIPDDMDQDEHLRRQQHELNRRKLALGQQVRRGLIRYLYLAVDASANMREMDFKPDRFRYTTKLAQEFVKEYFDQNPISQLGILMTRKGEAERLTELSADPKSHIARLQNWPREKTDGLENRPEGEASLQNLLELAATSLNAIPDYGQREVVLIYGSITTCDPGDIFDTINKLKKHKVRVSIISVSAEMYICRRVAEDTNGTYSVALDPKHFSDLVMAQVAPPPTVATSDTPLYTNMVLMGFPSQEHRETATLAFDGSNPPRAARVAHICPRCKARVADLPTTCNVCGLPLVSSAHIARSYHHLFPVPHYTELKPKEEPQLDQCHGCLRHLDVMNEKVVRLRCPRCKHAFCMHCESYIHESLHNCPGCFG